MSQFLLWKQLSKREFFRKILKKEGIEKEKKETSNIRDEKKNPKKLNKKAKLS